MKYKYQFDILVAKKGLQRNDPCPCGSGKKFKKCCIWKPFEPSPELLADFELGQKLLAEYEKDLPKPPKKNISLTTLRLASAVVFNK